mgnify:CR=1 FL=1
MTAHQNPPEDRLSTFIAEAIAAPPAGLTTREVRGPIALPNKATAVIGMRRAGKTSFLHQQRQARIAKGAPPTTVPYWNFEDPLLHGLRAEQLPLLLDEHRRQHAGEALPLLLCLDEIQLVPGWERFVRRLLDTERCEVFVSGSSAAMLSREIATSMRGRGWEVVIHPFSFREALAHASVEVPAPGTTLSARRRSALERALLAWLQSGGFPEVQAFDPATRRRVLQDYVDVVVLRDVVERHGVTSVVALRWLVRHLLGNAGSLFSVQKFFDALKSQGLRIGKDTVHELVAHLTDCFLVRGIWIETDSERRRMVNARKTYPVDTGLMHLYQTTSKSDLGHALETAVLVELERRAATITYLRTPEGYEVDFVARHPDGRVELIQVSADASAPATAERELRALLAAQALLPEAQMRLIPLLRAGAPHQVPNGVKVTAAVDWFLGAK